MSELIYLTLSCEDDRFLAATGTASAQGKQLVGLAELPSGHVRVIARRDQDSPCATDYEQRMLQWSAWIGLHQLLPPPAPEEDLFSTTGSTCFVLTTRPSESEITPPWAPIYTHPRRLVGKGFSVDLFAWLRCFGQDSVLLEVGPVEGTVHDAIRSLRVLLGHVETFFGNHLAELKAYEMWASEMWARPPGAMERLPRVANAVNQVSERRHAVGSDVEGEERHELGSAAVMDDRPYEGANSAFNDLTKQWAQRWPATQGMPPRKRHPHTTGEEDDVLVEPQNTSRAVTDGNSERLVSRDRPSILQQAARTRAELSKDWLSAAEVSELLGSTAQNASELPRRWRQDGRLLAAFVPSPSPAYRFPPWQFDTNGQPVRVLSALLTLLRGPGGMGNAEARRNSGWEEIEWFLTPHALLDATEPAHLLRAAPDRVLAAAQTQFVEDSDVGGF